MKNKSSQSDWDWTKILFFFIILFGIAKACSGGGGMNSCIKNIMEEENISYEEAKERCEEYQMDSQTR